MFYVKKNKNGKIWVLCEVGSGYLEIFYTILYTFDSV